MAMFTPAQKPRGLARITFIIWTDVPQASSDSIGGRRGGSIEPASFHCRGWPSDNCRRRRFRHRLTTGNVNWISLLMRHLPPSLSRSTVRRAPRRRGFTLIEAAIVTVIIGLGCVSMLELLAAGT